MRRSIAATLVVSVLLSLAVAIVVGAAAIAHGTLPPHCVPHGSETIAANRSVRVYSFPPYVEGVPTRRAGDAYACLLTNGLTVRIVKHQPSPGRWPLARLGEVRLAGTIVAYAEEQYGLDTGCTGISTVDMATKRSVVSIPIVACFVDTRGSRLIDLVVNRHGSVAWIVSREGRDTTSVQVHAASASGGTALLDEGPEIAVGSLRLAPGGEVSWVDSGRTMYAPLA